MDETKTIRTEVTLDAALKRGTVTISAYLAERGIEGGVQLEDSESSAAVGDLQSRQDTKYDVGEVLGRGGMGAVLDAKDLCVRRHVAMKMMLDGGQVSREHVLRFIQEAQVTGQLEHPNIVPVHELAVNDQSRVFYTMKYVRGVTLKQILAGIRSEDADTIRDYPLPRLLTIFQKVCDAIAFAHSKGVVHRDLKPENIMIGGYGEVLVLDWGLGKIVELGGRPGEARPRSKPWREKGTEEWQDPDAPASSIHSVRQTGAGDEFQTMDGKVMGTPVFMAPEQAHGHVEQIDSRTDVYSLGAILYNILALCPPIDGTSTNAILLKVMAGDITPPVQVNTGTKADTECVTWPSRSRPVAARRPLHAGGTPSSMWEAVPPGDRIVLKTG